MLFFEEFSMGLLLTFYKKSVGLQPIVCFCNEIRIGKEILSNYLQGEVSINQKLCLFSPFQV